MTDIAIVETWDWDALQEEIHNTAVKSGFWEEDRNFGEMIALAISETSEALEEHREGRELWFANNGKPEGVVVELADCVIRILDTIAAVPGRKHLLQPQIEFLRGMQIEPPSNFGEAQVKITARLVDSYRAYIIQDHIQAANQLVSAIAICLRLMARYRPDIAPERVIKTKMNYNATRPYKHGKAY